MFAAICLCCAPGCEEPIQPSPRERARVAVIRERPGEARVEGLGPIRGFAQGRDCTFMHCLELVLEAGGQGVRYDELMGLSGAAFRLQFRMDRWDVGNPDPVVGDNCLPRLFPAIGWAWELRVVRRDEHTEANALRQTIEQSINRGIPVLAANIIPPEDWGVITGYRRDRSWLCRAYHGGAEREDRPATGWPSAVVLLNRAIPRQSSTEARADSIRHAIELFEKGRTGDYAVGEKAFDTWCQSLTAAREENYVHPNFWTYVGLIDARGAAVRHLRSIAGEFGPRALHVNLAADWYDQEVRLLLSALDAVPPKRRFPDSLPPVELRNRQIEILRQAQSLERSAIDALKKAI